MLLFDDFLSLNNYKDSGEWFSRIQEIARKLSFDMLLVGIAPNKLAVHGQEYGGALIADTYPNKWRAKYDSENYANIDPVIAHSFKSVAPICWGDDMYKEKLHLNFREEAISYGLRYGISFPLHGPSGEFGVLSLCLDAEDQHTAHVYMTTAITSLVLLRDLVLQSALNLPLFSSTMKEVSLTKREKEILQWSARGKTSWEISRICGCSEANINFHISNINRKFGVTSRRCAAVQAYQQGLISI